MGIPAKLLLADDEKVVLHLHTHWKAFARPTVVLLAASAAAAYAAAEAPPGLLQRWMRVAALVIWTIIVLSWVVWPLLNGLAGMCVLTTRRIIITSGVIRRCRRDIPLSRITAAYFTQGFVHRFLGCGTLMVESPGEHGQLVLADVLRVEKVQLEINRLLPNDRRAGAPGGTGGADPGW
jgi:uncharacterized membrane protein YdbT with pleckstrin-like domain